METTFSDVADGGAFDVNQIPELTSLAREYEDFSGPDKSLNGGYPCLGRMRIVPALLSLIRSDKDPKPCSVRVQSIHCNQQIPTS